MDNITNPHSDGPKLSEYFEKFRNQYVAEERHKGVTVVVHIIKIPGPTEQGFYRQATSISAFRGREMERSYGSKAQASENWVKYSEAIERAFILYMRPDYEWTFDLSDFIVNKTLSEDERQQAPSMFSSRKRLNNAPEVEHADLWEFYNYIGYDHKKKKFL